MKAALNRRNARGWLASVLATAAAGLLMPADVSATTVGAVWPPNGTLSASSQVLSDPTINLTSKTLYDGNTIFTGVSFTRMQFDVPAAGHLEVTLKDMEFPALAGALSFALIEGGTVLGLVNGTGSFSLDLDGPRTLFGYVYAVGAPSVSTASYYLNVTHEYAAPIPLPAAIWLLLGGLGMTGWAGSQARRATLCRKGGSRLGALR